MRSFPSVLAVLLLSCHGLADDAPQVRAFPGALGYGAFTPGGRGGAILRVTTLAAGGPGSLIEALLKKGPRIIVFEVGGVIDLERKRIKLKEPFVTVAGATAPAPGITLIRGSLDFMTHDVVIQHLCVRPGEAGHAKKSGWSPDAIATTSGSQILIDHCSLSWAVDENLSASGPRFTGGTLEDWRANTSHHVTFSNCLIAEGLSHSTHEKGEHSKGTLLHDNTTFVSVIGNLYASNRERSPMIKGGAQAVIANNWIFNPGRRAMHLSLGLEEWKGHDPVAAKLSIVGNVFEHGPDTVPRLALFTIHGHSPVELFMADNLAFDRAHQPAALLEKPEVPLAGERPLWPEGYEPMPAARVKEYVARNAGARPWDRDPIDARIVREALAGVGKIINGEAEAEGYPVRAQTKEPFHPEEWDLATMQRKPGK